MNLGKSSSQKRLKIKTNDGFNIYGTLDSVKSKRLIIFIHGITGSQNEHQYFNAAPFFNDAEFDVLRFSFYESKEDSRSLTVSSLSTHVNDLRVILDKFKGQYDEIVLVGHSLGALVILKSDLSDISKIVLWDPSSTLEGSRTERYRYIPELNKYIRQWGKEVLLSKEMIDEWSEFDMTKQIGDIDVPVKLIFAGDRKKYDIWKPYLKQIKVEMEFAIIEGATHVFVEKGTEEELFEETLKWLKH